ncbi:MAG: HNH endonuclease [Schleiferilactobacillus perolens]|uniref:HNH endonuclease n=1 Tax=Schleiferilactobacillus perolens TaxID=100468 RepID=UPI0039EA4766
MAEEKQIIQAQFGVALKYLREARHRTRQEVVDHNDISLNALASIENGAALVKLNTLTMLLNYYDISLEDFAAQYVDADGAPDFVTTMQQLINDDTRFFILDTKGATSSNNYSDQDFSQYHWNAHRFNKMRTGDWFVYRRPQGNTKFWYFFGAGQIGPMTRDTQGNQHAQIINSIAFTYYLTPDDLRTFPWMFRTRTGKDWQRFFNQYGMTEITRADFNGLLTIALDRMDLPLLTRAFAEDDVHAYRDIHNGHFGITEKIEPHKQRIGQRQLAEAVRLNYGYQCAVTGIRTRPLLVASHIIPWADSPQNRLDPSNVICLSPLWDKAFDQGLITFDAADQTIRLAPQVQTDNRLYHELAPFKGKKMHDPVRDKPKREFLEYHNRKIFKG